MNKDVLVLSIAVGNYEKLFQRCIDSQVSYCQKHGYDFLLVNKTPRPLQGFEAAWLKLPLIEAALKKGYKWVAFIDADCEVRANTPSFVDSFSRFGKEKSVFVCKGRSGRINSGAVYVKNDAASLSFFRKLIESADQQVPPEDSAPYENGHVIWLGKNNPAVQIVEKLWNNTVELDENSYVQHYCSGNLRRWYMSSEGHPDPVKNFKYYVGRAKVRIRKKLEKTFQMLKPKPAVTKMLNELMVFYKAEYPAFK